ncbi:hypothetical protein TCAL_06563, partial [Tigriopus californicus]
MLISFLATRVIVLPFNSLQGLVDESDFRISLSPGTSYMDAFKQSQDPIWQKAWKDRIEPYLSSYSNDIEGQTRQVIQDTGLAFYDNFFAVRTLEKYGNCEVIAIPAKYDVKPYAYAFAKNSPYLQLFNHYLKHLRERGTTKNILDKYESRPQICPDYTFVCLLLGLIIGSVFLAMERSSHGLSQITGLSFNWLHSYGQEDPDKEDLEILNDDTINVKAKRAIQSKTQRIQDLEELVVKLTAVNTQSVESNQGFIYADEKKN